MVINHLQVLGWSSKYGQMICLVSWRGGGENPLKLPMDFTIGNVFEVHDIFVAY